MTTENRVESIGQRKPRVLVVDDEDPYRRMLERVLGSRYEVQAARSAAEAVALVDGGFHPDVAVCDIHMPGEDGFALAQRLLERLPNLGVIFLTGFRQRDSLQRAMSLNAMFLEKNVDADEIRAVVERIVQEKRKQETELAQAIAGLRKQNEGEVRRVAKELRGASDLQREMMPASAATLGTFQVRAHWRGCSELCGDLYDYCAVGDGGKVAVLCADVMGHGVAPAMLTPLVKSAFRSTPGHDPLEVVQRLRQLFVWVEPKEYFVALFCAVADPTVGTLTYACAGHPAAYLLGRDGLVELGSLGPPVLGAFEPGEWRSETVKFGPGDGLLLFTDGLIEAGAPAAAFGQERVKNHAARAGHERGDLLDGILEDLRTHLGDRPMTDDLTLLLLEATGDPAKGR